MEKVAPSERFRSELDEVLAGVGSEEDPIETALPALVVGSACACFAAESGRLLIDGRDECFFVACARERGPRSDARSFEKAPVRALFRRVVASMTQHSCCSGKPSIATAVDAAPAHQPAHPRLGQCGHTDCRQGGAALTPSAIGQLFRRPK
jgi:hypothetical protein